MWTGGWKGEEERRGERELGWSGVERGKLDLRPQHKQDLYWISWKENRIEAGKIQVIVRDSEEVSWPQQEFIQHTKRQGRGGEDFDHGQTFPLRNRESLEFFEQAALRGLVIRWSAGGIWKVRVTDIRLMAQQRAALGVRLPSDEV